MGVTNPAGGGRRGVARRRFGIAEAFLTLLFALALAGTVEQIAGAYTYDRGIDGVIASFLLIGGPIASYALFWQVRGSGRPYSAALMHAVAVFFALMSLAIADLGSPLTNALGKREEVAPTAAPATIAADTLPAPTGAKAQPAAAAPPKAQPFAGLPDARTRTEVAARAKWNDIPLPTVAPPPPPPGYSLYDMLSLIGMIATVSLIVLGALVPEETKLIERKRDERRRALAALDAYSKVLATFYEDWRNRRARQGEAFAVRQAADELDTAIGQSAPGDRVSAIVESAHDRFGVSAQLTGRGQTTQDPPAAELAALLSELRTVVESAYPRQDR